MWLSENVNKSLLQTLVTTVNNIMVQKANKKQERQVHKGYIKMQMGENVCRRSLSNWWTLFFLLNNLWQSSKPRRANQISTATIVTKQCVIRQQKASGKQIKLCNWKNSPCPGYNWIWEDQSKAHSCGHTTDFCPWEMWLDYKLPLGNLNLPVWPIFPTINYLGKYYLVHLGSVKRTN